MDTPETIPSHPAARPDAPSPMWNKTRIRAFLGFPAAWATRIVFVCLVLPVLYCLEPFRRYRFARISYQQLGVMAGNAFVLLQRQRLGLEKEGTRYIIPYCDPANRQLMKMFSRHLLLIESRWLTRFMSYCQPLRSKTRFITRLPWSDMDFHEFYHAGPVLRFTDEEETLGRSGLDRMGIGRDDWFVCIHTRDAAYKDLWRPEHKEIHDGRSFRNSAIEDYLEAANHITSLGGFVLRMGHTVEHPLPDTGNPRIIDYATKHRTDFLDIYLCAKCRFFLGNSSGLFVVSSIFGVPAALANMWPIGMMPFNSRDLYIPLRLRDPGTGDFVSYRKAHEQGFFDFDKMFATGHHYPYGYEWINNSPTEILELTKDMLDMLEGREPGDREGARLSARFKESFNAHIPDNQLAGSLAPSFAGRYRGLIEAPSINIAKQ